MTFKEFEATVKHFREDIYVYKSCRNKSVGVVFLNGKKCSKVYNYYGSYHKILNSLGIHDFYTDRMIAEIDVMIRDYEEKNGKKPKFNFGKNTREVIDNTKEIEELNKLRKKLLSFYRAGAN